MQVRNDTTVVETDDDTGTEAASEAVEAAAEATEAAAEAVEAAAEAAEAAADAVEPATLPADVDIHERVALIEERHNNHDLDFERHTTGLTADEVRAIVDERLAAMAPPEPEPEPPDEVTIVEPDTPAKRSFLERVW